MGSPHKLTTADCRRFTAVSLSLVLTVVPDVSGTTPMGSVGLASQVRSGECSASLSGLRAVGSREDWDLEPEAWRNGGDVSVRHHPSVGQRRDGGRWKEVMGDSCHRVGVLPVGHYPGVAFLRPAYPPCHRSPEIPLLHFSGFSDVLQGLSLKVS